MKIVAFVHKILLHLHTDLQQYQLLTMIHNEWTFVHNNYNFIKFRVLISLTQST